MLADGSKALNREKLLRMIIRFAIYIIGIIASVRNVNFQIQPPPGKPRINSCTPPS